MYQHAEHYFRLMNVDDGESQQQRQHNRNNGADQRSQPRNGQQMQDNAPTSTEADKQPDASNESGNTAAGHNGSGRNREARGNGAAAAERGAAEESPKSEEIVVDRAPRRPRRNTNRPRARAAAAAEEAETPEPAAVAVEPKAVVEPEAVVETAAVEGDAKDA